MASSASLEASEIRRRGRRRLLGAVTLVLLVVVFVPMILDSDPRPQRAEPSLVIPSKENAPPLPAPPPAAPANVNAKAPAAAENTPATPAPATAKPEPAPAPAASPPSAQVQVVPKEAAPAEAAPSKPAPAKAAASPRLEGFAVQVGAFRDEGRLRQARQKLEAAGVVHYTERVDVKGGTITRLRAGPFKTRDAAEKAQAKLKHDSIDGKVVPLP